MSASVGERRDFLRVRFAAGSPATADFHWFWLRHLCPCCVHAQTRERTLRPSEVPLDVRPERVEIDWPGHQSVYALDWLRGHAYAPDAGELIEPPCNAARLELARSALREPADLAKAVLARVAELGAAVVCGAGSDTGAWIDAFAAQGLAVIPAHFGRIEDLRADDTTDQNTDQLLAEPPRYQMLRCMRPADEGGENAVADARAAAETFETLSGAPIGFQRVQRRFEKRHVGPLHARTSFRGARWVRGVYFDARG